MSGGSWNYIEHRGPISDGPDAAAHPHEFLGAAARLRELGDDAAASVLMEVAELMQLAQARFETVKKQLHMMEWIDSCDMAEDEYVPLGKSSAAR